MVESSVRRIEVEFARSSAEKTELIVSQHGEGLYDISGAYLLAQGSGFPSHEMMQRTGSAFADRIEELRQKLAVSCHTWYHHYCRDSVGVPDRYYPSSWSIRIDNGGVVERWEGLGCAPRGIDNVYGELVAFGMPGLRLGYADSFESVCSRSETDALDPWHIMSYRKTLKRLVEEMDRDKAKGEVKTGMKRPWVMARGTSEAKTSVATDGKAAADVARIMNEFVDDTRLFLRLNAPDTLDESAFAKTWKKGETIEALCAADVSTANRRGMMLLLGAFVRLNPSHDDVVHLVRSGAFDRWCDRLRDIPHEEHEKRMREEREKRLAIADQIDTAVRKFVAAKNPFTSHDVAKSCGVTPQQASGRIRAFVQRGEVVPLEGSLPRRYRAA